MARLRRTSSVPETPRQRLAGIRSLIFHPLILLVMIGGTCSVAVGQRTEVPRVRTTLPQLPPPITTTTLNPTQIRVPLGINTNTSVKTEPVTGAAVIRSTDRVTATRPESASSGGAPSPEAKESVVRATAIRRLQRQKFLRLRRVRSSLRQHHLSGRAQAIVDLHLLFRR